MGNNQVLKFDFVFGLQPILFDLTIGKQPYITYFYLGIWPDKN